VTRTWRVVGLTLLAVLVVVAIAAAGVYVYFHSGFYSVAATYPDSKAAASFLDATMTRSVQRHAAGLHVPSLEDPAQFRLGFQHYRGMCVECHGAPGVEAEELAKGLTPDPPELVEAAGDWKPNELFWLTKNGVRMTGMPAWGPTHSDEEIWAVVAFTQRLPKLSEAEWKKLDREVPALKEG
jgi:mono/diheme cytochrome c family protein